jgi:hypothetical protein
MNLPLLPLQARTTSCLQAKWPDPCHRRRHSPHSGGDQMAAKKGGRKSSGRRKYGKAASKRVESAMRRRKKGTLRSGSGRKVKSRKQAIAIALSEARQKGAKVPRRKSGRKKSSSRKRSR